MLDLILNLITIIFAAYVGYVQGKRNSKPVTVRQDTIAQLLSVLLGCIFGHYLGNVII